MYELIGQGKTDPKFQEVVYDITKGVGNKNYRGEIDKIFRWAKNNIRYTRDPYGVEMVQDVFSTLNRGRADCDDFTILLGAAVETMGAPVRITTVSTRADLEPVHVYPEAHVGGRWVPLDATVASSYPGWKPTQGITDRKVWTRGDVGIHGYDEANIEGLGMFSGPFFRQSVVPINLTPGVPSDVAHTYADPLPGAQVVSPRRVPGAPATKVARYSDLTENPAPGDLPYNAPMPIRSFPMPEAIWSLRPRPSIPMKVDPWGHMKPWSKDQNAIFPTPNVPEDKYMSNVAGLGGLNLGDASQSDVDRVTAAVHADVVNHVKSGKLPASAAPKAVAKLIDAVQTGNKSVVNSAVAPATHAVVSKIKRNRRGGIRDSQRGYSFDTDESFEWLPAMYGLGEANVKRTHPNLFKRVQAAVARKLPGMLRKHGLHPGRISGHGRPAGMLGLGNFSGEITAQEAAAAGGLASSITGAIAGAVDPNDATAINNAVNAGIQAAIQVVAPGGTPAPASPGILESLKGWKTPALVVGGIAAIAYFMKKSGGRKYRSNPSRRRSGGRRGGKGGGLMSNKLVLLGAGVGAYLLLSKPAAAATVPAGAAPQSVGANLLSSLANLFKTPGTPTPATQTAQLMTAAGGLTKSLVPLFSSSPTPSTPAPSASTDWRSSLVTSLPDDYSSSNGEMITSYES